MDKDGRILGEERIQYNMKCLRLTRRQVEIHDVFMLAKMSTYPQSLTDYISAESRVYGISGDCIAEWIALWIRGEEEVRYSYG